MQKERTHITPELRDAYKSFSNKDFFDKFKNKVQDVKISCDKNRHIIIKGLKRTVSLYATTGTVNAAPENGYNSVNIKGMKPERAIERVISLANFGY